MAAAAVSAEAVAAVALAEVAAVVVAQLAAGAVADAPPAVVVWTAVVVAAAAVQGGGVVAAAAVGSVWAAVLGTAAVVSVPATVGISIGACVAKFSLSKNHRNLLLTFANTFLYSFTSKNNLQKDIFVGPKMG